MPKTLKFILPVIFWAGFLYVVLRVEYPDNITFATVFQLFSFFITLFLALIFTINLLLSFAFSLSISLGIILLLMLKSLDSLNIVSAVLTLAAIYLMLSYFRKIKKQARLTSNPKISTLRSLRKRKNG